MRSYFHLLIPRYRASVSPEGRISSFRWLNIGWDAITSKKMIFIQFGRRPVKFVCILSKKASTPLFLMAARWKIIFNSKRIKTGITASPINLAKLWRTQWKTMK